MGNLFSCQNQTGWRRWIGGIALSVALFSAQGAGADNHVGQAQEALQGFQQATDLPTRFTYARQMAAIRYDQGQLLAAQWWLRRAANYAPDRAQADRNRDDFRQIREQARLRPSLSFNLRPASNINNGAQDRILSLGDITLVFPSSALALSGVEYSGRANLEWRISQSPKARSFVDLDLYGRSYVLSAQARDRAPNAKGSDYALTQVALGLTHLRQLRPNWGLTGLRVSFGNLRSGGQDLRRFRRVDLSQGFALSARSYLTASVFVEEQIPLRPDQPRATLRGLRADYRLDLGQGGRLGLALDRQIYDASSATASYRFDQLYGSYDLARPVFGTGVTLFAAASRKTYDEFSLSLDGRRDQRHELGATVVFNQATYLGFSPSVTLSAHRTRSNVDLYDTQGASMSLGFQSRF